MDKYTYEDIIIDPNDERAKVGEKYWFGDNLSFLLNDANAGRETFELTDVNIDFDTNRPFRIVDTDGVTSANFRCLIKPKEPQVKYVPFDLSKKEVRDKLRGKWIVHKETESEEMINEFGCNHGKGTWYCLIGFDSKMLLKYWTFLDGSPCGESIEE